MRSRGDIAWFASLLVLGGCSALVNPDEGALGGAVDSGVPDRGADADGGGDTCEGGCNDGVDCTDDRCEGGVCSSTPNDALCGEGQRCSLSGCVDASCTGNADCDDLLRCNGQETCEGGVCQRGEPVRCDDGVACTVDRCDEGTGECVFAPDDSACEDGVDCTTGVCGASGCEQRLDDSRCNDGFCSVGGRCTEMGCEGGEARDCGDGRECTVDTCSSDMAMCINTPIDGDMDGATLCDEPADCDDDSGEVFPGAPETCDGRDEDCDGSTDEGACMDRLPDRCETALAFTVIGSEVSFSGSFADYSADYNSECGLEGGRDAVFTFELAADQDYVIDTVGSSADTVLAVSPDCGGFNFAGHGCSDDRIPGDDRTSGIYLRRLGSSERTRRIFVLLDAYNSSETGMFTLNVRPVVSPGLSCGASPDFPQENTVVGFIEPSAPQLSIPVSCGSVGSAVRDREASFRASVRDGTVFTLYSDDMVPTLYGRRGCGLDEQECDEGNPAQIEFERRRDVALYADGAGAGGAFYTLMRVP